MMRKLLLLSGLCFFTTFLFGQATVGQPTKTISGKVTDQRTGQGLPAVSITIKGTTEGTVTKDDGTFSLIVPAKTKALVFSSVGFADQEVNISKSSTINIALAEGEGKNLDEVVVVAYGTQQRKEVTGASAIVKSREIANVPRASIDQILQGKVDPPSPYYSSVYLFSH